jgi:hypothetical protein
MESASRISFLAMISLHAYLARQGQNRLRTKSECLPLPEANIRAE